MYRLVQFASFCSFLPTFLIFFTGQLWIVLACLQEFSTYQRWSKLDALLSPIIIHQTHYENSDWSRAFNQFTIPCELDMINAISAANIAFIMSSSTSAWLLSPLECSLTKQNGWTLPFCFWGWIMWKMYNKTIIEFDFRMISRIIKTSCLCSALAGNTYLGFDNSVHDIMLNLIQ